MSNFWQRALTGIVFVFVVAGCILWNQWSFISLFTLIAMAATLEFYVLVEERQGIRIQKLPGMLITLVLSLGYFLQTGFSSPLLLGLLFPLVVVVFLAELFRKQTNPFQNVAYTLLGALYSGAPFALLNGLAFFNTGNYSFHLTLGFFLLLWTSDTGAYLSGKSFGRRKLFERISPKKTWEGTLGATILALALSIYLSRVFTEISVCDWMVVALIIVVFGTLGDLVESLLKRSLDVKDSGTILPGHGGLLDRFDGLILSVPMLIFYLRCIRPLLP